jgi:hypothetical protein
MRGMQTELLRGFEAFSAGQVLRVRKVRRANPIRTLRYPGADILESRPEQIKSRLGQNELSRLAKDATKGSLLAEANTLEEGAWGEKPCEGFAPTGPPHPHHDPCPNAVATSVYEPSCRLRRKPTISQRNNVRRSPAKPPRLGEAKKKKKA